MPGLPRIGVKALIHNNGARFDTETRYLFLKRSETFSGESEPRWDVPGGRLEEDETLEVALEREVREESGLKLSGRPMILEAQDILMHDIGLHVVRLTFMAHAEGDVELSDEHQEYQWATPDEALDLNLDIYMRPVIEEIIEG